jgi:porphobilinogen synthase
MRQIKAPLPAASRLRRLRRSPALRALTQETTLSVKDLIWPVFVREGENIREPVSSMPGVERLSLDHLPLY